MEQTKLLFALLRYAVLDTPPDADVRDALTVPTLRTLYAVSKKHDMAHLLAHAVCKLGRSGEDAVFAALEKQQMLAVYRYEQIRYAYEQITTVFEGEKIDYLPLKGSVIRNFYPEGWMRTSCDIDILVKEESLDAAIDALVRSGYRAEERRAYHDVSLYSPTGVHLELHFHIGEATPSLDGVLSRVWDYAVKDGEGYRYRMTPEFFLFHHLAHASYHFVGGGCGIRPFLDFYLLQKAVQTIDQKTLDALCAEASILTFAEGFDALSRVWFGGEEHTALTREMEGYLLGAGVYGNMENKVAVARKQSGGRLGYTMRRIFMPYDRLKLYYPRLEKAPVLYPFYQIKRWCRILISRRAGKAVSELRTIASVNNEESTRAFALCRALGLR